MDADKKRSNQKRLARRKIQRNVVKKLPQLRHKSSHKGKLETKNQKPNEESMVQSNNRSRSTSKSTNSRLTESASKCFLNVSAANNRTAVCKGSSSRTRANKKEESLKKRSIMQMINKYFEEGKQRAKRYVRKALSFAVDSGYLIPTDSDGKVLRVSRTLTAFKLARKKEEPEARRKRRIMRRGEGHLKKNERRALRRKTSPPEQKRNEISKKESGKTSNSKEKPKSRIKTKSDVKKAKRPKSSDKKTTQKRKSLKRKCKTDQRITKKKRKNNEDSLNMHSTDGNHKNNNNEANTKYQRYKSLESAKDKPETSKQEAPLNEDKNNHENVKKEPDAGSSDSD